MNYKNLRVLTASIAALGVFAGFTPAAWAGLSGSCGMLMTVPHPFMNANVTVTGTVSSGGTMNGTATINSTTNEGVNVMAVIDFTNDSISYNVNQASFSPSSGSSYTSQAGTTTFSAPAAGPVPGSYIITFTPTGTSTAVSFNILPVNGGNTFLVQGVGDATQGVCQAL